MRSNSPPPKPQGGGCHSDGQGACQCASQAQRGPLGARELQAPPGAPYGTRPSPSRSAPQGMSPQGMSPQGMPLPDPMAMVLPKTATPAEVAAMWRQEVSPPKPEGGACQSNAGGSCGCGSERQSSLATSQAEAQMMPPVSLEESGATPHSGGMSRRQTLQGMVAGFLAGVGGAANTGCTKVADTVENTKTDWSEFFKKNYRVMTDKEKEKTVARLTQQASVRGEIRPTINTKPAVPGVLYGYAFNISKCKGYMDCVKACVKENNLDRRSEMQYIRIFEVKNDKLNPEHGNGQISHQVPAAGHVYMGTQCFQCENPPCVKVCPVGATWREPDGIVVIDYDWCIGCRYCQSACPYWARRFNWDTPEVPKAEINPNQHYLGNRPRKRGVMEKCTFCIQRTREGQLPACAEACPTGARVFGNLLDPKSEIRYVLKHKKVFRLKEDLGAEPKFWYFMD